MEFFNDSVANALQYISLSLEVFGLLLAFIEIKTPKTADKIEKGINRLEYYVKGLGQKLTNNHHYEALITVFIFLLFVAVVPTLWGLFTLPLWIWIIFDVIGVIVGLTIGLHLLVDFIESLNAFSNGRALGSLGIFVSSLGVMGELYQLITIWVN